MWRSKDKCRAWWFHNVPHGLQNRRRSCCRSRHRSFCWRRWGLPTPLFCPVVAGGVRAHLNARGLLLPSCWGKNPASPWQASLESANLALARVYGFLPRADEEPASSMERRGRRMGAARWDGSSLSPRNLTLLEGVADNTEEDGRGRGRGASSLHNLPLESRAILATETRLRRRQGRRKPRRGYKAEGRAERLLKRFGCTNDTMINKHPSPMKGRGQVCSNEEQFAFPLLICNQILYHVFLRQP
jgi:hypothetical protein